MFFPLHLVLFANPWSWLLLFVLGVGVTTKQLNIALKPISGQEPLLASIYRHTINDAKRIHVQYKASSIFE